MCVDLRRIRDRKLVQWGVAYLGGSWLLLQLADVLQSALGIGPAEFRLLLLLLLLGLPFVLVLAWYHGEKGRQQVSGPELVIIGALLALVATVVSLAVPTLEGTAKAAGTEADLAAAGTERLDPHAVAVLPFANVSADPEDAYFTDGIHEELITRLSKVTALRVISRTSVMQYRDAQQNVREIAEALGAGTVLEGSVRRSGEGLRITAQLIDARTDHQLWAESYDRMLSAENAFGIQSDIAERVSRALETSLTPEERNRVHGRPTEDPVAYSHYLRGRYLLNQHGGLEGYARALDHFRRALELDSTFALAYSGIADVHVHLDDSSGRPQRAREEGMEAARRALALDEELPEAHVSLGHLLMHKEEWQEAQREYERAIELDPSNSEARLLYAFHLSAWEQHEEAIHHARRALDTDPVSIDPNSFLGYTYFFAGRYEDAIAQWQRLMELYPEHIRVEFLIAVAQVLMGRTEEGMHWAERGTALAGGVAWADVARARVLALTGATAQARQILSKAVAAAPAGTLDPLALALAYAAVGDLDRAFDWMDVAGEADHGWLMFLRVEPGYRPLHADPRFAAWLERMRLAG